MLPSVIGRRAVAWASLDHLVGAGEKRGRDGKADGLRGFAVLRLMTSSYLVGANLVLVQSVPSWS
jgi:hypothetical protein